MPTRGGFRRQCTARLATIMTAMAGLGMSIGSVGSWAAPRLSAGEPTATVANCRVTDGDTIRCGDERIRLLGIDAPELPGHCRGGRICAPGDPYASSASLAEAMAPTMTIERIGTDRYGRTLAMVAGSHGDLSCWQLGRRQAIYKPQWDDDGRVALHCPNDADARIER